jgi:hypothetical protein
MRLRLAGILFLALVLMTLIPLAYAAVTDPAWATGVWDDDDDDAAILAVASGVGAFDAGALQPGLAIILRNLPSSTAPADRDGSSYWDLVRAPPTS